MCFLFDINFIYLFFLHAFFLFSFSNYIKKAKELLGIFECEPGKSKFHPLVYE